MRRALLLAIALAAAALPASAAAAPAPQTLWKGCVTGSAAGECKVPRGIAANPTTGRVYVADQGNQRIVELTAWGEFVKAWGWGVRDGSPQLQTCTAVTGCQEGIGGNGAGQLNYPQGVALDSAGNLYVADLLGRRVQKFDADGNFILMFGGEVNKTTSGNLCTAASGDTCGVGTLGTANGQFGTWEVGSLIGVGPGDTIYVGDQERVQKFDANGNFLAGIPMPAGELVQSLAVDGSGNLFVSFFKDFVGEVSAKENIRKYGPAGVSEALCTAIVKNPKALAVDAAGAVYAVDGFQLGTNSLHIRKFSSSCVEDQGVGFTDGFERSTGIATSVVTEGGESALYVSNYINTDSYLRAYHPPPDRAEFDSPPTVPPTIAAQYATSATAETATLVADINPHFWESPFPETTFFVEYGTGRCSDGGCNQVAPADPAPLEAGVVDEAVSTGDVVLSGLEPGTTYHYRFVAESGGGGPVRGAEGSFTTFAAPLPARTDCPNQAFRTGASARLPDCRAFELVSPADRRGGDVGAAFFVGHDLAAADGERATYTALRAFAEPEAAPLLNQLLSVRTPGGWRTEAISPPRKLPALYAPGGASQFKAFSPDLCEAWVVQDTNLALTPGAPSGVPNLYRRSNCTAEPAFDLISSVPPPGGFELESESNYYVDLANVSADGAHAVFRADAPLTPDACPATRIFQVYVSSPGGELHLVSALPDGTPNCTHASGGLATTPTYDFRRSSVLNAVSGDGQTVFWSAGSDAAGPIEPGSAALGDVLDPKLYVRVNALEEQSATAGTECTEAGKACTLAISEAPESVFWAADQAGTTALYTVGSLPTSSGELGQAELREFNVEAGESQPVAGGIKSVVGASDDLSRVYLVSTDVLSGAQENSAGGKAVAGQSNLYLYEKATDTFTFVALLQDKEARAAGPGGGIIRPGPSAPAALEPRLRSSRISPDGLHLAFTSYRSLTGYDSTDAHSGQPDSQVFLYDAEEGGTGALACISCNPSGARPVGAKIGADSDEAINWAAGRLPGWPDQMRPSRFLGPDGNHLFFQSFDRLVLADTNGREDVYEWRRAGSEAECTAQGAESYVEASGGCISLVSGGRDPVDSRLLDAGVSGRDVFFSTEESLVSQDPALVDVYDARVGGGFELPVSTPACDPGVEDSCQGPAGAPPAASSLGTAGAGAGNVRPLPGKLRCPKGKRSVTKKAKTRCVKRDAGKKRAKARKHRGRR
ncbi:MAG TPA: hypothetical protein VFY48_01845 [Solirubrobacterales bacterium]|nr:hypothetical protein [Solirubrobacterales bacterium]